MDVLPQIIIFEINVFILEDNQVLWTEEMCLLKAITRYRIMDHGHNEHIREMRAKVMNAMINNCRNRWP
jgi:hypothetical protein